MQTKRPKNALIHGLYARDVVLPWEDANTFLAFHQAIREELNPAGPLEDEAAREVAEQQWRKQRLAFGFLLPYYKIMPPAELLEAAKGGLVTLANYLADAMNAGTGTFFGTTAQALDYVKACAAGELNGAAKLPAQPGEAGSRSVVDQAYDPITIEKYLKVEAMIDNRVSKALARLVGLKEYKKLYGSPKALPAAPAPALAPPTAEAPETAPEVADLQVDTPGANTEPTKPSGWTVTSRRGR